MATALGERKLNKNDQEIFDLVLDTLQELEYKFSQEDINSVVLGFLWGDITIKIANGNVYICGAEQYKPVNSQDNSLVLGESELYFNLSKDKITPDNLSLAFEVITYSGNREVRYSTVFE